MLVVDVAEPPVQRRRVLGAQAGGDPGTEPTDRAGWSWRRRRASATPGRIPRRGRRPGSRPSTTPARPGPASRMPGAGGTTSTRSTGPGRSRQSFACHGAPSNTISAAGYAARSASSAGRAKMKSPSALARSTAIRRTSGTRSPVGPSTDGLTTRPATAGRSRRRCPGGAAPGPRPDRRGIGVPRQEVDRSAARCGRR